MLVTTSYPTIDALYRATWQAIAKMYNEQASEYDTTMATGFALLSIDPVHGTASTAIAPKMGMEATSLSRTLKTLEEKKLIERVPNPDDGRSVLLKLTPLGLEKRDLSKSLVLQFNKQIEDRVGVKKLEAFKEVSETIIELIQSKKIYANEKKN
ncbi:MAG: MarR family transcriptional regulator [Bacteroidetes bacterium]|nr:MarR family transcriptional regulator [Bacteroidota bacterium]MDA1084349.1 MarR family transcriptional regulator [Bacteroidota bacterium]